MREVWRHAHLKQPPGSRDGYRTRQLGGNGLKSTTGGSQAAPLSRMDRAQPERRETKCTKLGAKPPNGLFWEDKLSHGLAHITRPSPIAVGDHRSALRTRDARSKIVHGIMI